MTGYANASASPVSPSAAALHEPHESQEPHAHESPPAIVSAGPIINVEMRSVNNRFLDVSLKLPDDYRGLEPALRELITARFKRGKIELRVSSSADASATAGEPDDAQLARIAHLARRVRQVLPDARDLSVHEILQMCRTAPMPDDASPHVLEAAKHCIVGLAKARAREGERLAAVLNERIDHLRALADAAEPLVPAAVARLQQRFLDRWNDALESTGHGASAGKEVSRDASTDRALNEAAAYAIRIDVAEELARLRSHLDEIARLIEKGGEIGKRLEFLIQELLREANTLGSKSPSIEMTTVSVDMKVAIEQLREQVANVE